MDYLLKNEKSGFSQRSNKMNYLVDTIFENILYLYPLNYQPFMLYIPGKIQFYYNYFVRLPIKDLNNDEGTLRSRILKLLEEGNSSLYRFIFIILFIVILFLMPILSFDFGIAWDEFLEYEYAKDALNYFTSFGKDKNCLDLTNYQYASLINYGNSFNIVTAFINKFIRLPFGEYEIRHILNALAGFIAIVFAALTSKKIGSWRTACLAFIFIFLTPRFLGHSMNNPTDIPFAAAYIFSIYFIIQFLEELPKPKIKTLIFLSIGIAGAISIRMPGIILIAYLLAFTFIFWLNKIIRNGFRKSLKVIPPLLIYPTIVAVLSYFLGIITWPYALQKPLTNPFLSFKNLSNWKGLTQYENFEGIRSLADDFPWYYISKWISISNPLFILIGFVIAIMGFYWLLKYYRKPMIYIIPFALFCPLIYAIYTETVSFNGWRHFLFIYPLIVVLSAIGWEFLLIKTRNIYFRMGIILVLLLLMLKSTIWMIKNHPNEYVYFNELVGGIKGAYGNYETDYYGNSMREAVEYLIENENIQKKKIYLAVNCSPKSVSYYSDRLADSISVHWVKHFAKWAQPWDYALFLTRIMSKSQLRKEAFPPKGTIHTIKVDKIPLVAIVKKENDFNYLGYSKLQSGDFPKAYHYYLRAVQSDPMNEESMRMLAAVCNMLNKLDQAEVYAKKAIELYPENCLAYEIRGTIAFKKMDYYKAINQYDKALKYQINQIPSIYNKGLAYLSLRNYDEASDCFNSILELDSNNITAHLQIAEILKVKGKYKEAKERCNKVLKISPDVNSAFNKIGELNRLMSSTETYFALPRNKSSEIQ